MGRGRDRWLGTAKRRPALSASQRLSPFRLRFPVVELLFCCRVSRHYRFWQSYTSRDSRRLRGRGTLWEPQLTMQGIVVRCELSTHRNTAD
jgi:hypothetical protein